MAAVVFGFFIAAFSIARQAPVAAQAAASGSVHGQVADSSGGVLPGVTVSVSRPDGGAARTAVTNDSGEYSVDGLPIGPTTITFELTGFDAKDVRVAVQPGITTWVAARLALAALRETVNVSPSTAVDPLAPPPLDPIPTHDRASVCGPAKSNGPVEALGTIASLRDSGERTLYGRNDQLVIDGGTQDGLFVGRNLVVRRTYRLDGSARAATAEHTSGLLQIVAAKERSSIGVVVYACDEFRKGDYLAAFNPEPIRPSDAAGVPVFENAARVLFADEGSTLGAPGRMMVIDRGESEAIRAGQRLTLFHRDGIRTSVVGDAVVVAVRFDSATIRVEHMTDLFQPGDWAAPQRP